MAQAIISGLASKDICVADPSRKIQEKLALSGIRSVREPSSLPEADCTVVAVKPFHLEDALTGWNHGKSLVISVVAGTLVTSISQFLKGYDRIIRAMPNTPALHKKGVTGLYAPKGIETKDRSAAESLFSSLGFAFWVEEEENLDSVTALSGSGPAYFFYVFEILKEMAREYGFDESTAQTVVLETMNGAVHMLGHSGKTAKELREAVTSPGGTTEAALQSMENDNFRTVFHRAVNAAKKRAGDIGRKTGRQRTS